MLCGLIMAGGKGTRFWPLSTEERPKQFLNLVGEQSMIQMTVSRLEDIIPVERIFIVTDSKYEGLIREHLPHLPIENIIIEPVGMNTAPCIALSAMIIEKKYPDSTLAVLPSDHLIENEELFRNILSTAQHYVEENKNAIVTLGMEVTRPEVGYGYIKYSKEATMMDNFNIHPVDDFVEKPNLEVAKTYMNEGCYLWNGGMFIWKSQNIVNLTKEYLPQTYDILMEIVNQPDELLMDALYKLYPQVQNISVDYGIMENAKEIYVIPSNFGWDDIGSWLSLERYRVTDKDNNVIDGEIKALNSRGNIVISKTKPMVLCGIENLILVETDDVVMIMSKDQISKINDVKAAIS